MRILRSFLIFFLLPLSALSQQVSDTAQPVEIIRAGRLGSFTTKSGNNLQTLTENVVLRQGTSLFYCDSCVINRAESLFEAFGKVHINDNDTAHVYSDRLRYRTDTKVALLTGNVRLTDGEATLTTPELEYDLNNSIGNYRRGGRVVNKGSVLTSREGTYFADIKDVLFRKSVELKDPGYYLRTDSLLYNTGTEIARFIAQTYIRDSSGRTIETSEGFYDLANRQAEFSSRTTIVDGSLTVSGDRIANNDQTGVVQLQGRAAMRDTAQGIAILADEIFVNKKTDAFLATKKPLMIVKQDEDSIYITADTLFSARLTALFPNDTTMKFAGGEKDSTNRYFEAYRNVRVFQDSVQSVSDSLFYSFRDSTFHLFHDPIVWSRGSQITGDTIYLYTKNRKADRVQVIENSFLLSEIEPGVYHQIKSSRMDGYFLDGVLDSVRARGLAESIYFLQDEDSAYTGANQTSSDLIDIFFQQGELYKVVLRSDVSGTVWPISQKGPDDLRLTGFRWQEARRPKTKYDLFQ